MYIHDAVQHGISQSDSWAATVTKVQTVGKAATDDEETARWKLGWLCAETTAVPAKVRDKNTPFPHWMENVSFRAACSS